MTTIMTTKDEISANDEADNILAGVAEDAGQMILKFNKQGQYLVHDEPIAIGTEFLAHTAAWQKVWTHFGPDGSVIEPPRIFPVKDRSKNVPERDELGDDDQSTWAKDENGRLLDPWLYQYYLPLQDLKTGKIFVFVTQSGGGQLAVRNLCEAYANRLASGQPGQPIMKLGTKEFGRHKTLRPDFEITGYEAAEINKAVAAAISAQPTPDTKKRKVAVTPDDMDEEIPF
jgi:hypothetical protein